MKNSIKIKAALGAGAIALGAMLPFVAAAESHLEDARDQMMQIRDSVRMERDDMRGEIKEKEMMFREDVEEKREMLRMEIKDAPPAETREKMETFRQDVMTQREDLRTDIRQKREEFRNLAQERLEALRGKVGTLRAERIEEFFARMVERFEAALDRLRSFADRIGERLDHFEELGKDVSELRNKLDLAGEKIAEAEDALNSAKDKFAEFTLSENLRGAFAEVRMLVSEVKEKVKEAHRALVDVINSIKGASGRLLDEAGDNDGGDNATTTDSGQN